MEELLNSPAYQTLLPYMPYLTVSFLFRLFFLILLCINSRKALLEINEENRFIHPNMVWLLLVPFLNIYWNFVAVGKLKDSLNNEFYDRKIAVEENPTFKYGSFFAWCFLIFNFPVPLFISFLMLFLSNVALLLYWFSVREHRKLLEQSPKGSSESTI